MLIHGELPKNIHRPTTRPFVSGRYLQLGLTVSWWPTSWTNSPPNFFQQLHCHRQPPHPRLLSDPKVNSKQTAWCDFMNEWTMGISNLQEKLLDGWETVSGSNRLPTVHREYLLGIWAPQLRSFYRSLHSPLDRKGETFLLPLGQVTK